MSLVDEVTITSNPSPATPREKHILVYYIAGNPGLIGYYQDFLHKLHNNLSQAQESQNVTIHGASLPGFEVNPNTTIPSSRPPPPHSLPQQIEFAQQAITSKAASVAASTNTASPLPVILIAHSVGAYILLSILSHWQSQHRTDHPAPPYRIIAGICLFPTVLEIAASEKGRQLSPLLGIPGAWRVVQWLASNVLARVPLGWWDWAAALTPGTLGKEVTEALVRSSGGVGQVLFMAGDEMRLIRENRWRDLLWGGRRGGNGSGSGVGGVGEVVEELVPKTKLYFYWGEDDYWVDNKVRDDLIALRASRGDSETEDFPQMRIDQNQIPHTFSLDEKNCAIVAKEVAEYICEIKQKYRKESTS